MAQQISEGISITVETFYHDEPLHQSNAEHMFTYRITIENFSEHTVQLLSRHWYILDAGGKRREVQGEGVVGRQPVIEPNMRYQYVSAASIQSEMGKMYGTYTMMNTETGRNFKVEIPEFQLIAPFKLN